MALATGRKRAISLLLGIVAVAAGCGGTRPHPTRPADHDLGATLAVRERDPRPPSAQERRRPLLWPAEGVVSSGFGPRRGSHHDGIDISAPVGTPVRAADDGVVRLVGEHASYGRVVLLRHPDGLETLYAHNHRLRVQAGDRVRAGQTIATVGESGRTTGPNLHFEVRRGRAVRNPLFFLPPVRTAAPRQRRDGGG